MKYHAYCPKCPEFFSEAASLEDARNKLEIHEKEKHDGKPVGCFGKTFNTNEET